VRALRAPRLRTEARRVAELSRMASWYQDQRRVLAGAVSGADVVVNAAGMARPTGGEDDSLFGANALLPLALSTACDRAGVTRFVHVSSAAVQGDAPCLDEDASYRPMSAYASSKALGEQALLAAGHPGTAILRLTSVHATSRPLTRQLVRFATGPWSSVAAPGDAPTPQVLLDNVAAAVAHLCASERPPPPIVLQPWEGWTTAAFLTCLAGHPPTQVPVGPARALTACTKAAARLSSRAAAYHRRLQLLWEGQDQVEGWLRSDGFRPPRPHAEWESLARSVRRNHAA
jgi:uncharacterized protein YbjT (DUF2867 family)